MSLIIKAIQKPLKHFDIDVHNIELNKGDVVGLIGPNGSGKSSLLKLLTRELETDMCDVYWNGSTSFLNTLAYIPDSMRFKNITVDQYFSIYVQHYTLDRVKFDQMIKQYHIAHNQKIDKLSLGQSQKLMFALVQSMDASLYIFDEPSDGYDPISIKTLKNNLYDLSNDDTLIVIATHQLKSYEGIFDRILYIENGKIVFNFSTIEIEEKGEEILGFLFVPELIKQDYVNRPSLTTFVSCVGRRNR